MPGDLCTGSLSQLLLVVLTGTVTEENRPGISVGDAVKMSFLIDPTAHVREIEGQGVVLDGIERAPPPAPHASRRPAPIA